MDIHSMKLFEKSVSYSVDFGDRDLETILKDWNNSKRRKNLVLNQFNIKKVKSESEIIVISDKQEVELYYIKDLQTLEIKFYNTKFIYIYYFTLLFLLGGYALLLGINAYYFMSIFTLLILIVIIYTLNSNINQSVNKVRNLMKLLFFYQKLEAEVI